VAGPEVLLSRLPLKIGLYPVACFLGGFSRQKNSYFCGAGRI